MSKSTVNDITFGCVDFIVAKVGDVPSQQVSEFIFGKLQGAVRGNVAIQIHDMHRHAPELVVHEDANGIRELPDAWTPDSLSILSFDRQELPGADELILGGLVLTKENKTYPTLSGRVSDMRFVEEASNDGGQLLQ